MRIKQVSLLTLVVLMTSLAQPARSMEAEETQDGQFLITYPNPKGFRLRPPYWSQQDRLLKELDRFVSALSKKEQNKKEKGKGKEKEKEKEKEREEDHDSNSIATLSFNDTPEEIQIQIFFHALTEKGFNTLETFYSLMKVNKQTHAILAHPSFLHQTLMLAEPLYRFDSSSFTSEGELNPIKVQALFVALNRVEGFASQGDVKKATQVLVQTLSYFPNSCILPYYLASYNLRQSHLISSTLQNEQKNFVMEKMVAAKAFFSQSLQEEKRNSLDLFKYEAFLKLYYALPDQKNPEDEKEKGIELILAKARAMEPLEELLLSMAQVRLVILLNPLLKSTDKEIHLSEFARKDDLPSPFFLAEYFRTGDFNTSEKIKTEYTEKDFNAAFKWYTTVKDNKNNPDASHALFQLGMAYWNGTFWDDKKIYIPKNARKGFNCFTKAAKQGSPPAQYQLAKCYLRGEEDTPIDETLGLYWLEEAAHKGHRDAQYDLGMHSSHNNQNDEAIRWLEKAARQGHEQAAKELAELIEKVVFSKAKAGDSHNQYKLGLFYLLGLGVDKDEAKGVEWLKSAADKGGYSPAQFELSRCHLQGRGVPINEISAFQLFERAIKNGHKQAYQELNQYIETNLLQLANNNNNNTWAQYRLGLFYFSGLGVPKNETLGIQWLAKSSDGGFEVAQYEIGRLYVRGLVVPKDEAKGVGYLNLVVANGKSRLESARYELGFCYLHGIGAQQDKIKGLNFISTAALNGNIDAKNYLEKINIP